MTRNIYFKYENYEYQHLYNRRLGHVWDMQKQPPEVYFKKDVLRNFAQFIRKHLHQSLFLNEVAGLSLELYQKRDFGSGVFLLVLRNF